MCCIELTVKLERNSKSCSYRTASQYRVRSGCWKGELQLCSRQWKLKGFLASCGGEFLVFETSDSTNKKRESK